LVAAFRRFTVLRQQRATLPTCRILSQAKARFVERWLLFAVKSEDMQYDILME
jgi:hypothetical protein